MVLTSFGVSAYGNSFFIYFLTSQSTLTLFHWENCLVYEDVTISLPFIRIDVGPLRGVEGSYNMVVGANASGSAH